MIKPVKIGKTLIGPGHPCYFTAEIGINHNGDVLRAMALMDAARQAGADAVKFQAGDPERYVNPDCWDTPRETPWGTLRYLDYRQRMELSDEDFARVDLHAKTIGLPWFVSPLDAQTVARFEPFDLPAFKVASPKLTDTLLLQRLAATGRTVIASTGMSSLPKVEQAVTLLGTERLVLLHAVSAYPCEDKAVNLKALETLQSAFPTVPIGYSGHETGIWPTIGAIARGACVIERHFTDDRAAWGSDQAASLEPSGFALIVKAARSIEAALSANGTKALQDYELKNYSKFRHVGVA